MDMFDEIMGKAKKLVADDADTGAKMYMAGFARPKGHALRDRTLQSGWDKAAAKSVAERLAKIQEVSDG